VDISERDYLTLDTPPVDGTYEPEASRVPERINIVSDEIEAATEEDLQRIIEEEGRVSPRSEPTSLKTRHHPAVRRRRTADRTSLITQRTSTSARTWREP